MNLLLDTCTFLWLALEPGRISSAAQRLLDDPGNVRQISQVSMVEIVLKYRAGKLPLPMSPEFSVGSRRSRVHSLASIA